MKSGIRDPETCKSSRLFKAHGQSGFPSGSVSDSTSETLDGTPQTSDAMRLPGGPDAGANEPAAQTVRAVARPRTQSAAAASPRGTRRRWPDGRCCRSARRWPGPADRGGLPRPPCPPHRFRRRAAAPVNQHTRGRIGSRGRCRQVDRGLRSQTPAVRPCRQICLANRLPETLAPQPRPVGLKTTKPDQQAQRAA